MRFKAKLASEQVSLLYSLVTPISRLTSATGEAGSTSFMRNGCILYLDNQCVRLSIKGKSATDTEGISCFAELTAGGGIFLDHRIESNADNNAIVMELDIVQLRVALQSVHQRHHDNAMDQLCTVLKLAKRNTIPCLCIDGYNRSSSGGASIEVHHAIPVRICRPAEMQHHLPPHMPLPDVQLEMASDKPLRTVVERMRAISPTVFVQGNLEGELFVSIEADGASIRTQFTRLTPRPEACKGGASECKVKVDSKKLATCLHWQQQPGLVSSSVLCLVENESLVLHSLLNPSSVGFFTYYIPVHFLSLDDPAEDN